MAENNPPQKKTPTDYISDSESSDEELNQHLRTSQEERPYDTIKGSAQATQAVLSYTMDQCNPTVERGPDRKLKIKPLPKKKPRTRQHRPKKNISLNNVLTLHNNNLNILHFGYI